MAPFQTPPHTPAKAFDIKGYSAARKFATGRKREQKGAKGAISMVKQITLKSPESTFSVVR